MCEGIGMWLSVPSRHCERRGGTHRQGIHATGPVLAAGRPFGLPRANVPACRGDLPRRFQEPAID